MPPKRRTKGRGHQQMRRDISAEENRRDVLHRPQNRNQHGSREDPKSLPSSEQQNEESGYMSQDISPDGSMSFDSICAGHEPKEQSDLLNELGLELKHESPISSPLPRRPGFGNLGKRIKLISNCFPIKVPSGNVYHYDVDVGGIDKSFNEENCSEDLNQTADEVTGKDVKDKKYRCLKTKEKRKVIQAMLERDAIFNGLYAAYDGEKNLYTRKPLRAVFPHTFTTDKNDEIKGRVTIKPVKKKDTTSCAINLDSIHAFYDKRTDSIPLEAIAAVETILRHGACLRFTPIGRSFFSPPGPGCLNPLGGGLEVWFGYHQGVILNQWNLSVNLDISATTFLPAGPLVDYIAGLLETTRESLQNRPYLTDRDINRINKKLKDKKVKATHTHQGRKYTVFKLLRKNAHELKLANDDDDKTVAQYFKERYGQNLEYPNLPCLQAKPEGRRVYLPVEVCELILGQHYNKELTTAQKTEMIKFTSPTPKERFQKLKNKVNFKNDKCVQAFNVEVSEDPMCLDGRVLDPPSLIYRDDQKVRPRDGSWNMRNTKFFKAAEIESWVVLSFVRFRRDTLNEFCECFEQVGRNLGMDINQPKCKRVIDSGCDIKELLSCMKTEFKANLVLIIVPDENEIIYRSVKKSAETLIGLVTQVITEKTFRKIMDPRNRSYAQLVTNVFLKINSKMGGINYSLVLSEIPEILWKPVIVIGADVNHPGSFRGFKSSLAACAGSLDARCSLYAVRTRPQKNEDGNKKSVEIIIDLEAMVMDLLRAFFRHTRQKPGKIVFYRDGVSEGEFEKVRNSEVASVRKACRNIDADYQPAITFIVVQKRHHMRFMLQDPRDGKNLNLPASTVIDTDVTHPENFDFYLSSHNCPKGTARPAHYTVIEDDNKFTANDLQKFTNQLCYTFVRCTKSISIPAPVAYAHLAAYRARQYLDSDKDRDGSTTCSASSTGLLQISIEDANECIKVVQELKNRMYFV